VELALRNNPEVRAVRAQAEATVARAQAAALWPSPALDLALEDAPAAGKRSLTEGKQTLGLTQTVPWPGKQGLDRAAARAVQQAQQAALAVHQRHLVREVKVAFLQVLAAEQALALAQERVRLAEAAASNLQERVAAGDAWDTERLQAELTAARLRNETMVWQERRAQAWTTLKSLLGQPDLAESALCREVPDLLHQAKRLLDTVPDTTRSPEVQAAEWQRHQAELEWRRARLEMFPDPTLTVAAGRGAAPDRDAIVELRLSLPLPPWDGGQRRRQEARARMEAASAMASAAWARQQRNLEAVRARLRSGAEQVARDHEEILPRARAMLQRIEIALAEGRLGTAELLSARQMLAELELAAWERWLELAHAVAEYEALIGSAFSDATTPQLFQVSP
jgi:cobalt-zinc-cadmium efflux system outer membrane protein